MAWHHYVKPIPDVETRVDVGLGGGRGSWKSWGRKGVCGYDHHTCPRESSTPRPSAPRWGFPAKAVSFGVGQEGVWFDHLV